MPTYFARKAGNINATDVWATTPTGTAGAVTFVAGDVLMANSFAITVNVSTNLGPTGEVRNDNTGGATAGGSFTLSNGVTLTANVFSGFQLSTPGCVSFNGASPNFANVIGNFTGGGANNQVAGSNNSTGTLNITGNCTGGIGGGSSEGVRNVGTGTINITGNCTGGGGSFGYGARNTSTGTINITGNCTGGGGTSCHGANNDASGTLNIIGSVSQGGNANITAGSITGSHGANNASTGVMNITGPIYASEFDGGVGSANRGGLNFLTGPFYTSPTWGVNPIRCVSWRWATTLVNTTFIEVPTANLTAKRNLVTPDNATNFPVASNVRSGTTYGIGGALVGSCVVPSPESVASGVGVDNTIGTLATPTAAQNAAAVRQELAVELARIDAAISSRLAPNGTLATVTTLTNAPTVPSASAIASQVRTELGTELGRIDQPISSRLAAADYTAPSAAPTVTAIRQELDANSTRLANLDATISSRLADADYTSAPSVSDIRTELAVELGRLDASVSSRLASASYQAPSTPPTAAEITSAVWAAADKTGYALTSTERNAIAAAVESSILNENDGQAVLNAIVGAIGNQNLSEVSLVAAIRADIERTGGKLDSIPTTAAPTAAQNATAVWSAATRSVTGGTVDTLTNAPASVTPSDIWSHSSRTLTSASGPTAIEIRQELDSNSSKLSNLDASISSRLAASAYTAPTAAPTAAQNASAVRSELSVELARLDAPVSGATAPSAATVASAVRTELTTELAKVAALNTERLANVATTAIVGNLIAQANS